MIAMPESNLDESEVRVFSVGVDALGRRRIQRETFVECATCGFEPPGGLLPPRDRCPKCHAYCWRRTTRPVVEVPLFA